MEGAVKNNSLTHLNLMWEPDENSGIYLKKLKQVIETKYGQKFNSYWELHRWSVNNIPEFWSEMWDFLGIISSKRFHQVIDLNVPMDQNPQWFEGAELNYAENLLKHREEQIALIATGEHNEIEKFTYKQIYEKACLYSAAFRRYGIKKGDIVACYMSNRKEAIFAMLGVVSIGAIWSTVLPLMGPNAVLNRLSQIKPKILLTVDRFPFNNEEINLLENIQIITDGLPTIEKVVFVTSKSVFKSKNISKIRNSCFLEEFLSIGREKDGSVPPMKFEQVSVSHPVFITFTSGSTGMPKPLVHGNGVILPISVAYGIQLNTTRDSVWLAVSTPGWTSWNIVVTCFLFMGSKAVLYEGDPYFRNSTYFWDIVDKFQITIAYILARLLENLEDKKIVPTEKHSLKSLKVMLGVGGIVKPSSYDFMYRILKQRCLFSSLYASTEFSSSPALGDMTLPVYRGEINSVCLGYDLECLNQEGRPIRGDTGNLVLTKPVPNLLLGIWGDTDGTKCKETYFSKYPGKFLIGDQGYFNPVTKGLVVTGRSDEAINQRGIRFGSSEIHNIVVEFTEVEDTVCVSQFSKDMDERAVLFLKMRTGCHLTEDLVQRIRTAITEKLTVEYVPEVITRVEDIPYSIIGKKLQSIVKKIINHMPYNDEVVMNPECLKYYINREDLRDF